MNACSKIISLHRHVVVSSNVYTFIYSIRHLLCIEIAYVSMDFWCTINDEYCVYRCQTDTKCHQEHQQRKVMDRLKPEGSVEVTAETVQNRINQNIGRNAPSNSVTISVRITIRNASRLLHKKCELNVQDRNNCCSQFQQSSATNYVTRKRERDVTSLRNAQAT